MASTTRGEATEATTKRSHCSCHGGGTSLAFVVGLLDADNKKGGNRGVVTVAGWQRRRRRPAFVAGLLGVEVEDKLATGGNRRAQPVRTPGRCAIEIGAMVLAQMRRVIQNGESLFPAINVCEFHITNQNS